MGKLGDILQGLKPTMLMIMVQVVFTGVNICLKLAVTHGISLQVVIAYRYIIAVATLLPFALILERKSRPKMTWEIAFQAFFCALFGGCMSQNLYATSLALTSATYAAAMTNIMPAVTFIMAILCRMEVLGLKTMAGKAKVGGTLMCIGGAMVLTFYKGIKINIWSTNFDILHKSQHSGGGHVSTTHHHRSIDAILGPLLAFLSCLTSALSLIVQAKMSHAYPCFLSSTTLVSAMGSVQAVVYALCTERDWEQWKLGWNLRLLIVVYMGVGGAGLVWSCIMSAIRMRGPLFVSVFNPLLLILVALAGSLFLNEQLYLGSVLGAIIIIIGLYSVLWGKSKEMKKLNRLVPSAEPNEVGSRRESFKSVSLNVMAVPPSFLPATDLLEVSDFDDDKGEEEAENHDIEANVSSSISKE